VIAFCHVGLSTFIPASPGAVVIKNQYIVVLKSNPNLDREFEKVFTNNRFDKIFKICILYMARE